MNTNNIKAIAYCSIARGLDTQRCPNIFEAEVVKSCMTKYNKTGAQVLLCWGLQRGTVVIPKSNNLGRIKENIGAMDFKLSKEEMEGINSIDEGYKICNVDWCFGSDVFA